MSRIILVVAAILGLVVLHRYMQTLDAEGRKKFWIRFAFGLFLLAIIGLTLAGRLHYIAAIVAALLPFMKRLLPLIRYVPLLRRLYQQHQAAKQPNAGQQSEVTTSLLRMTLDHESGDLDGDVLEGEYAGKRLSELSFEQVLEIYRLARSDHSDSLELLEAYLDRVHSESWRSYQQQQDHSGEQAGQRSNGGAQSNTDGSMTRAEALAVLGLEDGATEEDIVQAHRRLIQKLHPDRGGNDYLAAKINEAKRYLLDGK